MTDRSSLAAPAQHALHPSATARPPRVWPPLILLTLFWAGFAVLTQTEFGLDLGFFAVFILMMFWMVELLLIAVWWLAFSRVRWAERLLVVGAAVVFGAAATALAHKSMYQFMFFGPGLPAVATVFALVLLAARAWPAALRRVALVAALAASWAVFPLLRTEGMGGDGQFALHRRWTPTAEQVYLAEHRDPARANATGETVSLQPGDWPAFRGPDRDGVLHDTDFSSWASAPPKQLWKRRIGPAWSSVAVVGNRLFTQEQLGDKEAVVCLDAATGNTVWSHTDECRWDDPMGGPGPRATPTFDNGRIFALGATGVLNCLDAATGDLKWSHNIKDDTHTEKTPVWGYSSSPLVAAGLVIVFAGETAEKPLLAYHAENGSPAWSAPAGKVSYVSPQLGKVAGKTQLLFVSERGLLAFDPATGAELWNFPTAAGNIGVPRATQPRVVGENRVLFDAGPDVGTQMVEVVRDGEAWTAKPVWVSPRLKPSFNDFVVYKDAVYGINNLMFTSIDLNTGKQLWKGGRYGAGQVLLVTGANGAELVIIAETGDVVLVAADPTGHRELARFPALKGKTWNHPVIAHGKLFVRNSEEMACYELPKKP